MLQIVLLCPQLVSYDERVGPTEICHGPAVELSVWKKKKVLLFAFYFPVNQRVKCCLDNVIKLVGERTRKADCIEV